MNETPVSLLGRLRVSPDNCAWQRLADLYLPLVQRWLKRHGLEPADADDLTQEILLTIVRELPEFEHSGRFWKRSSQSFPRRPGTPFSARPSMA